MSGTSDSRTSSTLLERLKASPSDRAAWDEFVARYRPMILEWCRAWGVQSADAEDVAQVVFVKLMDAIGEFSYDRSQRFRGWLHTVAHHAWIDLVGRRQVRGSGGTDPDWLVDLEARHDLEQRLAEAFDQERAAAAMERVKQRVAASTWEAFRLTALDGLSGAEAAARLGMSVANVYVAKHRVQELLKLELGESEAS
jgi:RNA polymerase sigma-70 factor (ECF subfamily)